MFSEVHRRPGRSVLFFYALAFVFFVIDIFFYRRKGFGLFWKDHLHNGDRTKRCSEMKFEVNYRNGALNARYSGAYLNETLNEELSNINIKMNQKKE